LVIADFANTTGDAVFDGTLRQGLEVQLQQSPFLSVIRACGGDNVSDGTAGRGTSYSGARTPNLRANGPSRPQRQR
jgi:hypothetical protein